MATITVEFDEALAKQFVDYWTRSDFLTGGLAHVVERIREKVYPKPKVTVLYGASMSSVYVDQVLVAQFFGPLHVADAPNYAQELRNR